MKILLILRHGFDPFKNTDNQLLHNTEVQILLKEERGYTIIQKNIFLNMCFCYKIIIFSVLHKYSFLKPCNWYRYISPCSFYNIKETHTLPGHSNVFFYHCLGQLNMNIHGLQYMHSWWMLKSTLFPVFLFKKIFLN